MAEFQGLLLSIQIIMHVAIAVRLMAYRPGPNCTHKPGVSFMAATLAGSSLVSAFNILASWQKLVTETPQPFTTLFVAVVLAGILRSRGNLAYFLPR